jgi:hypothetical protein
VAEFARRRISREGGIREKAEFARTRNSREALFANRYSGDGGIHERFRENEFTRRRHSRDGRIHMTDSRDGEIHLRAEVARWRNSQDSISRDGGIHLMEFARWRVSRDGRLRDGGICEMADFTRG